MNGEHLLTYLGYLDDELIQNHCGPVQKKPIQRWKKSLAAVACVCLVLGGTLGVFAKLGYFSAGCGSWPGTIVDGAYYYTVPHSGVWRYTPGGESEKLIPTLCMDGWLVNENGLYFDRGRSLYRKDLTTGKTQTLYTASFWQSSHIGFSLAGDGAIVLTVYDKHRKQQQQLLLDGLTGEVVQQLSGWCSYYEEYLMWEYRYYTVGGRTFEWVRTTDQNGDASYDLLENGQSVLPEAWYCVYRPERTTQGDGLLVEIYTGIRDEAWKNTRLLLFCADGSCVELDPTYHYKAGNTEYLFYLGTELDEEGYELLTNTIFCYEVATGESWPLSMDAQTPQYDFTGDRDYLYTSAPWADEQACWKILFDEAGRPHALTLISGDIRHAGR